MVKLFGFFWLFFVSIWLFLITGIWQPWFEHEFYISDILYGILGADFLAYHKLIVDISAQRLTESIKVEQCYRYGDSDFKNTFAVQSGDETENIILTKLKNKYPEVFDAALRERCCKHSVVASIETSSEEPILVKLAD